MLQWILVNIYIFTQPLLLHKKDRKAEKYCNLKLHPLSIHNQGEKGSKSYTIDSTRDLPMLYLTFVSSSPPASKSSSDAIIDLNAKKSSPNKNGNKRNNKTTDDGGGGTMFQCQELDGGNAIECKSFYFDADANISRIRLIAFDFK